MSKPHESVERQYSPDNVLNTSARMERWCAGARLLPRSEGGGGVGG
jgi:hypothetical protein